MKNHKLKELFKLVDLEIVIKETSVIFPVAFEKRYDIRIAIIENDLEYIGGGHKPP